MSVIFLLLTISTLLASMFLFAFIRAVRSGQYDDDRSPAVRILLDDTVRATPDDAGASSHPSSATEQP
ncbi:MAG TPA: cbb3-type cytochrome oxidase assembly protein CcoS [Flavobacteriales bacterium]|nr:cbb3-type cytochrome oxidase assembly protein CcoS [Flavobacteriales bacterium]HRN35931.1 cbb3-type cytochrome oxidase assembly protein CcoS [Flavobacteriales bacterium]HRO38652.1 cbb3-type cytochrome oxidase assembly protein CcoS [Flavobacteriales bacterium]HRP80987.1 cbb3-type cytochrome oxidase assembly protein CcoS [Flavobacteriales bacterium]HRQ85720.1 cbb3-type cytochrome oxidase assembly protein CcoS [Flavobacteriales bacterium]